MKERENRESWIRQTTALLAMSINRYLYISLYCHYRVASGAPEPEPRLNQTVQGPSLPLPRPHGTGYLNQKKQDVFLLHKNSCQGESPLDP